MTLDLTPAAGEAAFGDPALAGDWAAVLPAMLAVEQQAPWCSYAVRDGGRLAGMGGFKGGPGADGQAEIAYLVFVPERGRGLATAIAARLVEIAVGHGVAGVRAHTLPKHDASTRVLEANGFALKGAVDDPEDGTIWRWERT